MRVVVRGWGECEEEVRGLVSDCLLIAEAYISDE